MVSLNFGSAGDIRLLNFPKIIGLYDFFLSTEYFPLVSLEEKKNATSFTRFKIRTVAVDLRGYNLSERPAGAQNYKIQYMVDDLRALVEHLSK